MICFESVSHVTECVEPSTVLMGGHSLVAGKHLSEAPGAVWCRQVEAELWDPVAEASLPVLGSVGGAEGGAPGFLWV